MGAGQGSLENLVSQMRPDPDFWRGKRVVLTGHTGFKGAWLALWLHRMGAEVTGIALAPETQPSLFELADIGNLIDSHIADIRDREAVTALIRDARPQIVLHLAAQAIVLTGYEDPIGTFASNAMGTAHCLDAVRGLADTKVFAAITTDKVYRNLEEKVPFRETDHLGGYDPYSASKAAAEIVISSYRDSYLREQGVAVASARAGNVIGGGDWSANRLIPDAVRAWGSGTTLEVRRPDAIRPWQHVLEPLAGYLRLCERLWHDPSLADGYNFGPHTHEAATVREVLGIAREAFGAGETEWGDGTQGLHEAGWLSLETAKARRVLDVAPNWTLEQGVRRTMDWYREQLGGAPARDLCARDIAAYEGDAAKGDAV